MARPNCPTPNQLLAYQRGETPEDGIAVLVEHLGVCRECQAMVATFDEADNTLVARLRRPAADPYAEEPQQKEVLARVKVMVAEDWSPGGGPASGPFGHSTRLGQLGDYRLLEKLGEGGMGAVYKAVQTRLDRVVALKVLPKEKTADPRAVARFEREMKAVGRLDHPNIIRAHDAREIDGTHFLVMEYVDGLDLGEICQRHGPLPVAEACEIIRQAALGLQYAHEHGLVHRDLKPSNLMLTMAGQSVGLPARPGIVKILDLGLALLNTAEKEEGELTSAGTAMGTADYTAPEQAADSHSVDIRADIYSLGCTFYKLLTDRAPFSGPQYKTRMSKLLGHLQEPIPPVQSLRPDVPAAVVAVLDRMLAKDPAARFATPAEVAAAISPLVSGLQPAGRSIGQATQRPEGRTPTGLDLASLLADPQPRSGRLDAAAPTDPFASSALTSTQPSPGIAGPSPAVSAAGGRRTRWFVAAAVLLAMLGGGLYFGIIVRIKQPDGSEQEIRLSDASQLSVEKDGKEVFRHPGAKTDEMTKNPPEIRPTQGTPPSITAIPQPPPPLAGGEPLSAVALVARPAEIPGVQSWTIETRGHRGAISALTYSPDGRWLASAGFDRTIRLWDPATGRLVRALAGHGGANSSNSLNLYEPMALAWSPDGKTLASLELDGGARLWDRESGRVLRAWAAFQGQGSPPGLAWSPTGKFLASVGNQQVRVWDVESGKCLRSDLPEAPRVCWSPDGKALALAGGDRVQVFDAESGKPLRDFTAPESSNLNGVAWSGDGKRLAARGALACCWDAQSGRLLKTQKVPRDSSGYDRVVWSPDSKTVAFNGSGAATIWDPESDEVRSMATTVATSSLWAVAWSPDGKTIASGTRDGTVDLSDAASGLLQRSVSGHLPQFPAGERRLVAWSPDSTAIAIRTWLWEAASGKLLKGRNRDGSDSTGPAAWSPDGKVLALPYDAGDAGVSLVDPRTQEPLRILEDARGLAVNTLIWSSDNKVVATDFRRGTIRLWDASSGKAIRKLTGPSEIAALSLSPDNATLVSSLINGTLLFWDVASGNLRWTRKVPAAAVYELAWSPVGNLVAAGCYDGVVQLWDGATGELLTTLRGAKSPVVNLSWSQDGKTLLAVSQDGDTRLWEAASGQLLRVLNMPSGVVSPNGRLLAAHSLNTLRLWDAAAGRPLGTMVLLQNDHSFAVTADGHFRASPAAGVQKELIYIVQTDAGQETLTPEEFEKKHGWKNDPERVRLIVDK